MISKLVRGLAGHVLSLLVVFGLVACQTVPAPEAGFSEAQRAALSSVGFHQDGGDDDWVLRLGGQILFGTAEDVLSVSEQATVDRIARTLAEVGIDTMIVEGHTDIVGSEPYNQALSLRRAEAVARALAAGGLPYGNLVQRGFGSSRPIMSNDTPEGRMQNRRVTMIVRAR